MVQLTSSNSRIGAPGPSVEPPRSGEEKIIAACGLFLAVLGVIPVVSDLKPGPAMYIACGIVIILVALFLRSLRLWTRRRLDPLLAALLLAFAAVTIIPLIVVSNDRGRNVTESSLGKTSTTPATGTNQQTSSPSLVTSGPGSRETESSSSTGTTVGAACATDETLWSGRSPVAQERGEYVYSIHRDGTSAIFEVRDREGRVLSKEDLGGNLTGNPTLGRGSQSDADVWAFAVDAITSDLVYKRARADATGWDSEWAAVEGELTSDVAATSHQDWGIEVFTRGGLRANGEKTIDHATYVFETGEWAKWYYFEGSVTSAPEVVDYPDGRMIVRTCGAQNEPVNYRRSVGGTWTGWHPGW